MLLYHRCLFDYTSISPCLYSQSAPWNWWVKHGNGVLDHQIKVFKNLGCNLKREDSMSICSNFALNVILPIYLCIHSFTYLLLKIGFIAMFTFSEVRFRFVLCRGRVVTNVARICDPTPLLLCVAIKYV